MGGARSTRRGAFRRGPRSDDIGRRTWRRTARPRPRGPDRGAGRGRSSRSGGARRSRAASFARDSATRARIRGGLGRGSSRAVPARRGSSRHPPSTARRTKTLPRDGGGREPREDRRRRIREGLPRSGPAGRIGPGRTRRGRSEPRDLLARARRSAAASRPRGDASRLLDATPLRRRRRAPRRGRGRRPNVATDVEGDGDDDDDARCSRARPRAAGRFPVASAPRRRRVGRAAAPPPRGAVAFDPRPLVSVEARTTRAASSVARHRPGRVRGVPVRRRRRTQRLGVVHPTTASDARGGDGPATLRAAAKERRVAGDAFDRRLRDALEGAPTTPPHAARAAALQMRAFAGPRRARQGHRRAPSEAQGGARRTEVGRGEREGSRSRG